MKRLAQRAVETDKERKKRKVRSNEKHKTRRRARKAWPGKVP